MGNRINWIDHAKGIGIFLVVFAHMLRALTNSKILSENFWISFWDQWIYAFHMPLFFLISGFFIHKSTQKPLGIFLMSRIKTIVYPYFIWSYLQGGLQVFLAKYTNRNMDIKELLNIFYDPIMQFWFLYSLFVMVVLYSILHQFSGEMTPYYFSSIALFAYVLRILGTNIGPWGVLYQASFYMIYFAMGAIISTKTNYLEKIDSIKPKEKFIIFSLFSYSVVAVAVILSINESYIVVPFVATLGMAATISLAILVEQFSFFNFIREWGVFSLEIFVAHSIASAIIRIILQKLLGIHELSIYLVIGTATGLYVPIALALLCQRLKFPYLFRYGNPLKP